VSWRVGEADTATAAGALRYGGWGEAEAGVESFWDCFGLRPRNDDLTKNFTSEEGLLKNSSHLGGVKTFYAG